MSAKPRLLDQVRAALRVRHYSYRTERRYVGWIRRFVIFSGRKHPSVLGSPATQAQALAAILFLYKHVLNADLPWLGDVIRAARPKRLPVVLTRAEVRRVLQQPQGRYWLIAARSPLD